MKAMETKQLIQQAAEQIRASHNLVVLTGAGVSKESGVPTFRDAVDGLWAQYDPMKLATYNAFLEDPKLVWDWYEYRRSMVQKAQPNPGHAALTKLQQQFPSLKIITQNVDDLHERAGSQHVIHLHGNIAESKCFFDCQGDPTLIDISQLEWDHEAGPPACPHCGRWVRPNVVWFGEILPDRPLRAASVASRSADVMMVIGTSGLVTPAATLPAIARQSGAHIIEINPVDSAITRIAHIKLTGPSGEILPQILEALRE